MSPVIPPRNFSIHFFFERDQEILGDDFWGRVGNGFEGIYGDALGGCLAKASQGVPKSYSQAAPGWSKAGPHCSKLLQGCSRLLQSLPKAAPACSVAAPGLLQTVHSCHWAKAVPRPPKGCLWSPKLPKFCFWANSGPNAADGCPRFPSEAALELPQGYYALP